MRLTFLLLFISTASHALDWNDIPGCDETMTPQTECRIELQDLRPTQFAVGMRSVEDKRDELKRMKKHERHRFLRDHPVPLVVGPGGKFYLTDHHHLSRAYWEIDDTKKVAATITRNWRGLTVSEFWERMKRMKLTYLYDENGQGPVSPTRLPESVDRLRDDPYRSLAGAVRDKGGYEDNNVFFAEFQWAQFFRTRVSFDDGFKDAVKRGVQLARSPEARGLPGYRPR